VIGWVTYLVKVSLHLFKRWSPPEKEYWCNQLIEPKEDNHKLCNDIKSKQNVSISVFFVGVGILVVGLYVRILGEIRLGKRELCERRIVETLFVEMGLSETGLGEKEVGETWLGQ